MQSRKAQVSTEILILVGMALFLLVPVLLYAYSRADMSGDDLSVQKAEFAAHRIASLADSVGYLGGGSSVIDEVEMPPYVKSLAVKGRDVVIEMDSAAGKKQIVASSAFVLRGEGLDRVAKPGTYFIEVGGISAACPEQGPCEQVVLRLK